jgi:hypothetical protein
MHCGPYLRRHIPPDMLLVPEQMTALLHWYDTDAVNLHPVMRGARLPRHWLMLGLHPSLRRIPAYDASQPTISLGNDRIKIEFLN